MTGNYIGNNPNGLDIVLSDNYQTNNPKLIASTACVYDAIKDKTNFIVDNKTIIEKDKKIVSKDIAINGDDTDLASGRGQIGDCYNILTGIDFNTLFKAGRYWFTNAIFAECRNKPPVNVGGFCDVLGEESGNSYTKQIYHVYNSPVIYIREHKGTNSGWSETWTKIITEKNLATSSTPGIVKPGTGLQIDEEGTMNVVAEQTGCLPLTGGTMTGSIQFSNYGVVGQLYASNSEYRFVTLSAIGDNPGSFLAFMQDSPNFSGAFICRAMNANGTYYDLHGKNDGSLTWKNSQVLLPPGAVFAFAGNSTPEGCLICNGAAVSRTTYAKLFAVIGGTYGVGDGSTTFNLPNLTDRFIQGSETAGTYIAAGLPNIVAALNNTVYTDGYHNATGAFYTIGTSGGIASGGVGVIGQWHVGFSAQRFNSIYGNSTTVQPPAVTMRYYIKY